MGRGRNTHATTLNHTAGPYSTEILPFNTPFNLDFAIETIATSIANTIEERMAEIMLRTNERILAHLCRTSKEGRSDNKVSAALFWGERERQWQREGEILGVVRVDVAYTIGWMIRI